MRKLDKMSENNRLVRAAMWELMEGNAFGDYFTVNFEAVYKQVRGSLEVNYTTHYKEFWRVLRSLASDNWFRFANDARGCGEASKVFGFVREPLLNQKCA